MGRESRNVKVRNLLRRIMSDIKAPESCNHCKSTKLHYHQWGRTEYYSCLDCKKEVSLSTSSVQTTSQDNIWAAWDPKTYGFGTTDYKITLPEGLTLDNFDGSETDNGDW